ncbi:MAG TPA: cytochrome P450 [Solirubrobacteraceae bacterium]|nr:cytochrome P450 [Solirubrobacteraceae bacterium]
MPDVPLAQLDADPHPVLARLRAGEPVAWIPALGGWLVTRRDLAMAVMRDPAAFTVDDPRFTTARVVGPSMLSTDGPEHARHRGPFAAPFRLDAVRARFTAVVAAETDRLLDELEPRGEGDLRRGFAGPLAAAAVTAALGLESAGVAAVLRWYDAIVDAVQRISAGRGLPGSGPAAFADLSAAVLEALRADPSASLVAAAASEGGGLAPEEVVSNAAVLLFGGIETTEGMIANALVHLLTHPDQLALVRADPALVAGAIEESLRLEPAAATIDRYATRDVAIGGADIAAGDLVIVSIAAANRDPDAFHDPDRFDARRANARRHLAFAGGPHVCVGMHLARLEAHTALARALERLPDLELTDPAEAAPRGLVFRKPRAVTARWRT